ncbi:DUF6199 family natural product biosynthesis protein [Krasilnikovia sp. MM14-A1259]|uniref:DUF6199 family natural product biosynthesis protein n=1 Tax=Krasilnikovia sp. MM14-A1259 TaxID=3373539 RepID=UPI0038266BE8
MKLWLAAALLAAIGLHMVARPAAVARQSRWKFRNSEGLEPSRVYVWLIRLCGVAFVAGAIGLVLESRG